MTTLKTTCNDCGTVELFADQVRIRSEVSYVFDHCGRVQWRPMNERVRMVLVSIGCQYEDMITEDEVDVFTHMLDTEPLEWIWAELVG